MDEDEDLCPVCDSVCTCNHQSPDRGSARANGYQPKRRGPSRSGKGEAFMTTIGSEAQIASPASVPDEPATTPKPFKIRLILGQRKPSATPAAPMTPPPQSESPATSRQRRSINYTSSSESSHASSSKSDTRQYPRYTSPSPEVSRQLSPSIVTQDSSVNSKKRRGRPPKHLSAAREAAAREAIDFPGVFKEAAFGRPIRASAAAASSNLNVALVGPSHTLATPSGSAGSSKPPQPRTHTPSSAWFLGASPPKSLNHAPRSTSGPTRGHSQTSVAPRHGSGHDSGRSNATPMKRVFPPTPKPKMVVNNAKKPHTKKALNATQAPRISNATSNKKRRKGPAYSSKLGDRDDSSLEELTPSEEEAYREEDHQPAPSLVPRTYSSSRGKPSKGAASHIPSSGVVLGRPVGVAPGAYSKYISSSSSDDSLLQSGDDTSDDEDEDDEDIMKEEERMILKEVKKKEKQKERRKQRESGGSGGADKNHQRKTPKGSDMDISSSLSSLSSSSSKSSSSSSGSSPDSDAETDDDDDSDDDEEEDADADDIPVHTEEAGESTESESDEMDADLFFANFLSDEEDLETKEESSHSSAEDDAQAPKASVDPAVADDDEGRSDDEEVDVFSAGFGVNGTNFVDADAFELLQRRRLFRPGGASALSRSRGSRGHPYRRPPASSRKPSNKPPDAPLLITQDFDGRLAFANPFEVGKSLVDMEWEERQRAVMMNDEDVTSEESVSEEDAMMGDMGGDGGAVNDDDDDDADSTTETDFEGDTTFDEGLDEDGLPPQMAEQSQQLRSEREFNQRRLGHQVHPSDYSVPVVPEVLPPGVEVFQGGYSTVMYGRFDFPSLNPLGAHGRLSSTTDFLEIWNGIQEEEKSVVDDAGNVRETPAPFHFPVPPATDASNAATEVPLITSPSPREIFSASQTSLDSFRFPPPVQPSLSPPVTLISATILPADNYNSTDHREVGDVGHESPPSLNATILDAGDFRASPEPEGQALPSMPPRRLPTMGAFIINPAPPVDLLIPPHEVADDAQTHLPNSTTSLTDSVTTGASMSTIDRSSRPSTTSTPHKSCLPEAGLKGVGVIDDMRKANIPSPYASIKRRKKPQTTAADESDGSASMGQRRSACSKTFGSWDYGNMKRTTSAPASNRSSFSQSILVQASSLLPPFDGSVQSASETSFLHPAHVLDPPPTTSFGNLFGSRPTAAGPIDLSDVLDSAFLEDEDESGVASDQYEDDGASTTTDHQGALRNLTRWDRVPMGTFRRARAFGSAGGGVGNTRGAHHVHPHHQILSSPAGVSDGFSYGAMFREPDPFGPTAAAALWSDASPSGVRVLKGKGKEASRSGSSSKVKAGGRRPRIVISPVIFPIKEEDAPGGEPEDIDMGLVTGVEEEEGYFSKKLGKGGRDGTERERKKRKAERETTSSRSPVLKRAKSAVTVVGDESQVAST
ncbi:hypothetical protein FRB97_009562 [Tulasnella sp. 331]|nr:hypothetical protein FRB97_009562 [Tulasnella sp. 331]